VKVTVNERVKYVWVSEQFMPHTKQENVNIGPRLIFGYFTKIYKLLRLDGVEQACGKIIPPPPWLYSP
jgi:hypothetical protein